MSMQGAISRKRIAIMQPYLLPYIGYFQLIDSVDEFWIYDCVQYIRRGWMNRNRILLDGNPKQFSISVKRSPLDTLINEQRLSSNAIGDCHRLTLTLRHTGSPYRRQAAELVGRLIGYMADPVYDLNFSSITAQLLKDTCKQFGISTPLRFTSELSIPRKLQGQERILEVCGRVGADIYVNPPGGISLYDVGLFRSQGIDLSFLSPCFNDYPQEKNDTFVPKLSILDMVANIPENELPRFVIGYSVE